MLPCGFTGEHLHGSIPVVSDHGENRSLNSTHEQLGVVDHCRLVGEGHDRSVDNLGIEVGIEIGPKHPVVDAPLQDHG